MPESNGKRFIEKLIAASPTERRKFTVLGHDIYIAPATRKAMNDAVPKDGSADREPDLAGLYMLVAFAQDFEGNPMFEVKDIDALRERVSLDLLVKLEQGMMGVLAPNGQQIDEDIKADPPLASA